MTTVIFYTFNCVNENVMFFINNGLINSEKYKFVFIINDEHLVVNVPEWVDTINRQNIGYDFGAWSQAVHNYRNYDKYMFINSSLYGPCVPCYADRNWIDILTSKLSDSVKLFGCTINTANQVGCQDPSNNSHVQSSCFCTDTVGLNILIDQHIFDVDSTNNMPKLEIIETREIKMSRIIINHGYNIGCMLDRYKDVDFRDCKQYDSRIFITDVYYNHMFANGYTNKYEILFVKTTRDILKKFYKFENYNTYNFHNEHYRKLLTFLKSEYKPSAWKGHFEFAMWLVNKFNPLITVELGVDYGNSTFAFASEGVGIVYGIDCFGGDVHAGQRNTYDTVTSTYLNLLSQQLLKIPNIRILKGYFNEFIDNFENNSIDILHIDGLHEYESVKEDFENYFPKCHNNSIILFHDVVAFKQTVGKFFEELPYPKTMVSHSAGLGILSKNQDIIDLINNEWVNKLVNYDNNYLIHSEYNLLINKFF